MRKTSVHLSKGDVITLHLGVIEWQKNEHG